MKRASNGQARIHAHRHPMAPGGAPDLPDVNLSHRPGVRVLVARQADHLAGRRRYAMRPVDVVAMQRAVDGVVRAADTGAGEARSADLTCRCLIADVLMAMPASDVAAVTALAAIRQVCDDQTLRAARRLGRAAT